MPSFNDAYHELLKIEQGYVNHPADKGGKTNYGITQKTYEAFLGRKLSSSEAETVMRNMPIEHAKTIYKTQYWDKIGGDQIKSYPIAAALFDQAVNRGIVPVLKQAQAIIGVAADGIIGPKTIAALNSVNESAFLSAFITSAKQAYANIVANDSSQKAFYDGWMNRISKLTNYVTVNLGKINGRTIATTAGTIILVAGLAYFSYKYFQTNDLAKTLTLDGAKKV